ncbi:hypothetical protein SCHPADRAFT_928433 [Schizopora paradoxa]|uniref:Aminoglycoside phosphotransferase domain-containing protein n=1 Tax=Schizopora paradoxa TaxID=27342 RepID=A0A0H2RNP4_9AGAM|nr:hypothetical protein SCHPADRAFT_928433 [Schizopora paradoxa]
MGIGNNFFGDAATLFKKFYENPEKLTVCHSDSSPTYIAKVRGREPFIFQLRLADRLLIDMDNIQEFLGDLTPKTRVLAEDVYIGRRTFSIYEQSIIPGEPFSTLWSNREYSKLPRASEGIAKFFAKCLIPGILASSTPLLHDRNWYKEAMTVLDQACSTKDPLLTPYVGDFEDIRRAVQGGILDELPMSISNGNISAQNILVTKEGENASVGFRPSRHPLDKDLLPGRSLRGRKDYAGDRVSLLEDIPFCNPP